MCSVRPSVRPSVRSLTLILALVLAACGDDDGGGNQTNNQNGNETEPVCGNGVVETGEQCDQGAANSDTVPGACRTTCREAHCGDGVIDASEVCDGPALAGEDCVSRGFTAGDLACTDGCTFDTAACTTCGDGVKAGDEDCDQLDVGTATCASAAGLQHGMVACASDCTLETSGCHTCGNGVLEGPEACEEGDLQGETCVTQGYLYGVLACGPTCALDRSACEGYCGNGTAEPDEECDAADQHDETCATQGYVGGTLACTGWCMRSVAGCHQCGNGAVDPGEECDGADTGGETCATLSNGAMTGTLACTAGCRLDTSTCAAPATCGNGLRETGEACDGNDLMGQTCASLNPALYGGGLLRCSAACLYDTSQCASVEPCGNGVIEPGFGEQCEGALLGGATCQTRGFPGGTLGCTAACGFDTSACLAPLTCGNGVREGSESCDGDDLGFGTCEALGFLGGPLGCTDQCTYDTGACDTCGDGVVNGSDECDGSDVGGVTCEDLGYYGGTLGCATDCTRDVASCAAAGFCGDGVLHAAEGEECDGQAFGADSCTSRGFDGGVLTCTSGCGIDTVTCATCGNGVCEVGETGACPEDCLIEPLAAGGTHTCYVKGDGTVWCWGAVNSGQLGNNEYGGNPPRTSPVQVKGPGGVGFFSGAINVAAGYSHTCAIKSDGTVWCWGQGTVGQLGNGGTDNSRSTPAQVVGPGGSGFLTDVSSITASKGSSNGQHTCAVRTDGSLYCWGYNLSGQLGDGSQSNRLTPVQVVGPGGVGVLENVSSVSAGISHTCATTSAGVIYCWGEGGSGQLGHGGTFDSSYPVEITAIASSFRVSAGGDHSCAVQQDGAMWCWGAGSSGQLGTGLTTGSYFPTLVWALEDVASVQAGSQFTCAVQQDGAMWCWGSNSNGKLGDGTWTQQSSPVQVATAVVHFSAGTNHACADLGALGIRCWGENSYGQIGMGTRTQSLVPIPLDTSITALNVRTGTAKACAWVTGGGAWCWGYGYVGDGTTTMSLSPTAVVGQNGVGLLDNIVDLSVGDAHACAALSDGTAWCWGDNYPGKLGDGTTTSQPAPVQVVGSGGTGFLENVAGIAAGGSHSCATLIDGTAWCWGANGSGQLGCGGNTNSITPVQVTGSGGLGVLSDISLIAAGWAHNCAVLTDGTAWCWGNNGLGRLGDNTTIHRETPVQVLGPAAVGFLADISAVTCGFSHTCARKSNGTAWCWGAGNDGCLGNGNTASSYTPVQVGLSQVSQISAGTDITCALVAGGASSACWGRGSYGEMGNNTSNGSQLPVAPAGMTNLATISAGNKFTCAAKNDGTLWCWGDGSGGQLGDPDYYHQPLPVAVLPF